jgi:UDP-galactopyranose mutase
MREVVARTSWDNTARQMRDLINIDAAGPVAHDRAGGGRGGGGADSAFGAPLGAPQKVNPLRSAQAAQRVNRAIIGGGPTGLSAAYHLGEDTLLLERNESVGGWCRSIEDKGFTFDYAGHIMFSNDPYVLQAVRRCWAITCTGRTAKPGSTARRPIPAIRSRARCTACRPKVITECILGAIEARYGAADSQAANDQCDIGKGVDDCCADGAVDLPTGPTVKADAGELRAVHLQGLGRGHRQALRHPLQPQDLDRAAVRDGNLVAGRAVPLPDLGEIIEGALAVDQADGPERPLRLSAQGRLPGADERLPAAHQGQASSWAPRPCRSAAGASVALADGRRFQYDQLVSTMPLPELIKADRRLRAGRGQARGQGPAPYLDPLREPRHRPRRHHRQALDLLPGRQHLPSHLCAGQRFSPNCNRRAVSADCEISYSPYKPLPLEGEQLIQRVIDDLVKVGLLRADDRIVTANEADMPYAYVVYDHARADNV